MCTECGMAVSVGIFHAASCSRSTKEETDHVPQGEKSVAILREMIEERLLLSVESTTRGAVENSAWSMGLFFLTNEEKEAWIKAYSTSLVSHEISEAIIPLTLAHTISFFLEHDILNIEKFAEFMSVLDWTAPDVIE